MIRRRAFSILLPIAMAAMTAALLSGCGGVAGDRPAPGPPPGWPESVDAAAAFAHVERLARIRPRHSGSPGIVEAREYLADQLARRGFEVRTVSVEKPTVIGPVEFVSLWAEIKGEGPDLLVIGSHYDAKWLPGVDFEGANDSGSSTGLLLELAGAVAAGPTPPAGIRFVFFDGEECFREYGPGDGLIGSRAVVDAWAATGDLDRIRAMILLDMIGDRDLTLTAPMDSDRRLLSLLIEVCDRLGARDHVRVSPMSILDDHTPFVDAGVPAIDLIDFEFGSAPGKNDLWHTEGDRLESISVDSLDVVGRITLGMVTELLWPGSVVPLRGR